MTYAGQATQVTKFAYDGWNPATPATVGNENFSVWADLSATGSLTTQYLYGDKVDQIIARVDSSGNANWQRASLVATLTLARSP